MFKKLPLVLICLLFTVFDTSTIFAHTNEDPLVMGVFPRRNVKETIKSFQPIADYLTQELGRKVELVTGKNFEMFWEYVKQKRFDIVHYNQYDYIVSHKLYEYDVILKNEEFGSSSIAGSIWVRKDSGIQSIDDLRGKKIAFGGGPKAMVSYIIPTYLLMNGGLDRHDYREIFAKNPPNSLLSTYYKQSDAAGAGDKVVRLNVVSKQIDAEQMKLLIKSDDLPHIPWAVKTSLPNEVKAKIKKLMLRLNESENGKKILSEAKLTGIRDANDHDYDQYRQILKAVYGEKY